MWDWYVKCSASVQSLGFFVFFLPNCGIDCWNKFLKMVAAHFTSHTNKFHSLKIITSSLWWHFFFFFFCMDLVPKYTLFPPPQTPFPNVFYHLMIGTILKAYSTMSYQLLSCCPLNVGANTIFTAGPNNFGQQISVARIWCF